ncbi:putative protein-disulfide isomerase [Gillisia sp. Hel_I_86]|nr:putative protein-disulfide isomerase [Gillisia sp. Hel_I_86]
MIKDTIYYVYDPLCSWCYGFSPVIKKLKSLYDEQFDFQVISGGMQSGERKQPVSAIRDYLKGAYKNVTERTGVEFGDKFMAVLEDGNRMLDSIPPSIALSIVKDLKPEEALNFAATIQEAVYFDGFDWNSVEAYIPYLKVYDFDPEDFKRKFEDPLYKEKTLEDFKLAANFGVTGFPSVILKKDDNYYLIAQGFVPFDQLHATLEQVLASPE